MRAVRMSGSLAVLAVLAVLAACGSSNAAANAAFGTSLALTASAIERAQGGCYAVCVHGTTCNRGTGLCEATACKSACAADQVCEVDAFGERCVTPDPAALDPGLGPAWDPAGARDPSRPRPIMRGDDH